MVRVWRSRDGDADVVVMRTDDPRYRVALGELLFHEEDDGRHVKRFPKGSLTDAIFDRFRSHVEPLLRQTARLERAPWEDALAETARRLDHARIDWWLTGSAALAVRGVDIAPRDLDLVVSDAGARATAEVFADVLIEPPVATEDWFCRWFGRAFVGARVEWVGGVTSAADEPVPTDFGLIAARSLESVRWNELILSVPPLHLQREVSFRRGLLDRVQAIDSLG
jgi:hypothetical protein